MPRPDRKRVGPHHLRACVVYLTEDDSRRVRRIVGDLGKRAAAELLGVGEPTLEAAMDQGRMQRATYERLFAGVAKYEEERAAS